MTFKKTLRSLRVLDHGLRLACQGSLGSHTREWDRETHDLAAVRRGQVRRPGACAFEVAASMQRARHQGQIVTVKAVWFRAQRKDVILVETIRQLPPPHGPSSEFVQVASFGHENVSGTEGGPVGNIARDRDLYDGVKIDIPGLNVCDSKVGTRHHITGQVPLAVDRQPVLESADVPEPHEGPVICHRGQPGPRPRGPRKPQNARNQGLGDRCIGSLFQPKQLKTPKIYQSVDAGDLDVEEVGNAALFLQRRRHRNRHLIGSLASQPWYSDVLRGPLQVHGLQNVVQPSEVSRCQTFIDVVGRINGKPTHRKPIDGSIASLAADHDSGCSKV